jgi:hypothetical protein
MDENLVVVAIGHMIKTYVASLELQYLFHNQLVSNYLLVFCIVY